MNKCIVLCSNCHKEHHCDKEQFESFKQQIYEKVKNYKECPPAIDVNKILELKQQGKSNIEIAKTLNCSKSAITDIIKRNQEFFKEILEKETRERQELVHKVVELRKANNGQRKIAKQLNLKIGLVKGILKPEMSNLSKIDKSSKFDIDRIVEMKKAGLTHQQIGDKLGCSKVTITHIKNKYPNKFLAIQ